MTNYRAIRDCASSRRAKRSVGDYRARGDAGAPVNPPQLRVIGTIHTRHTELQDTPVQAALNPSDVGTIEIEPRYAPALDGLDEFSHLWLLTWLGPLEAEVPEPALRAVPFLLRSQPRELGILATRGPRRLNPIGLSLVRLVAIDGTTIHFAGVDMIDGTRVIDIKPYVDAFDRPATEPVRCGRFDSSALPEGATPGQLAQQR